MFCLLFFFLATKQPRPSNLIHQSSSQLWDSKEIGKMENEMGKHKKYLQTKMELETKKDKGQQLSKEETELLAMTEQLMTLTVSSTK